MLNSSSSPVPNLHALNYLPQGLHSLARWVRAKEINYPARFAAINVPAPVWAGLGLPNEGFLACCFNWFSVSLVSYLRLVRLIGLMIENSWKVEDLTEASNQQELSKVCVAYIEGIIPSVYRWRNKVAAHFAATDPRKADNAATLEISLMSNITYERPYFAAGAMMWGTGDAQSALERWALTETFEKLTPRLWPLAELTPLTSDR